MLRKRDATGAHFMRHDGVLLAAGRLAAQDEQDEGSEVEQHALALLNPRAVLWGGPQDGCLELRGELQLSVATHSAATHSAAMK